MTERATGFHAAAEAHIADPAARNQSAITERRFKKRIDLIGKVIRRK